MKAFVVFAAVIAVAAANAVGRSGWGSSPAAPSIDLELAASAAAAASGQASASQVLGEQVIGNPDNAALLSNANGVLAGLAQGEDITQIATADKPSAATDTINLVDVYQQAVGLDSLDAALSGDYAAVQNAAASDASGEGAIAAQASSLNVVSEKRQ